MTIETKVRTTLIDLLELPEDFNDTDTFSSFGSDSLDMMELMMKIEDEFDIQILDSQVENMVTPRDVINFLTEAMGDK